MRSLRKYIKTIIIANSCMICGFLFPVSGQQITVAKIKKLPVIAGQWQRISQVKNGIKGDLKSDYIFEFSPDATYLYMQRMPVQGSTATGNIHYVLNIRGKGKWKLAENESKLILYGSAFSSKIKIVNEMEDIFSFKSDTKNKNQFSVKKLEGRDTVEYIYKKISDHYTYMANY